MNRQTGFTLLEVIVVVVLIGILAGIALPNYQKSLLKTHEQDSILQLLSLHNVNRFYKAEAGEYLPGNGNLSFINNGLNINLVANGLTYSYNRSSATNYTVQAAWDQAGTAQDFTIQLDESALNPSQNPCCYAGNCPTLPDC